MELTRFTMFSDWRTLRRERAVATADFGGGEGSGNVKGMSDRTDFELVSEFPEAEIAVISSRRAKRAFQILFKLNPADLKSLTVVLIRCHKISREHITRKCRRQTFET